MPRRKRTKWDCKSAHTHIVQTPPDRTASFFWSCNYNRPLFTYIQKIFLRVKKRKNFDVKNDERCKLLHSIQLFFRSTFEFAPLCSIAIPASKLFFKKWKDRKIYFRSFSLSIPVIAMLKKIKYKFANKADFILSWEEALQTGRNLSQLHVVS